MKRALGSRKGFTLIELLVVIVIIALLMAIAIPAYLSQQKKAKDSESKQYIATAYRSARAASIGNNGNAYLAATTLATEIRSDQPQLTVVSGSCGSITASDPAKKIVVDTLNSTPNQLVLCSRSGSGAVFKGTSSPSGSLAYTTGGGSFGSAATFSAGDTDTSGIRLVDINGDGNLDLIYSNYYYDGFSYRLGAGNGTFGSRTQISSGLTGANPNALTVADFNGDGKTDVAVANLTGNNVSVWLATGSGTTFAAPATYSVGTQPMYVTAGDFNKDGKVDMAVTNAGSNNVSVLLNSGSGAFAAAVNYASGAASSPRELVNYDFNGDGNLDLGVASPNTVKFTFFLGVGDGTFGAASNLATSNNATGITLGDFNSDGVMDVALSCGNGTLNVFPSNGNGTFGARVDTVTGGAQGAFLTSGDLNNDGKTDVVFASNGSATYYMPSIGASSFSTPQNLSGAPYSQEPVVGDLNGDGKLDIVATSRNASNVIAVWLNS